MHDPRLLAFLSPAFFSLLPCSMQAKTRAESDAFGRSVCAIQDVNGDGRDDLIVGDVGFQGRGAIWTVSGKDGQRIAQALGESETAWLGNALTTTPDEDADGIAEVIAYVGRADGTALRVLSGKTLHTLRTSESVSFPKGSYFQWQLVGDLDGDGRDDLALGVVEDSRSYVDVYSAKSSTRILHLDAPFSRCNCGSRVATLRDLDGDGVRDLGISTGHCSEPDERYRLLLFSGKTSARIGEIANGPPVAGFAAAFGLVPDLDGDAIQDIALVDDASGWTSVWSGRNRELLRRLDGRWGDEAGAAELGGIARLRDLNGDGTADFAIAVDLMLGTSVRIYSGKDGSEVRAHREPYEPPDSIRFGACVADAGDLDGDGKGDYSVGASHGVGGFAHGYVAAYSGATGKELFVVNAKQLAGK